MSTPFERLKRLAFDQAARTMGVDAIWSGNTARVLFNQPNNTEERASIDFTPQFFEMEYRVDDFAGLYESVRGGDLEVVTIGGVSYEVRHVMRVYDGDTFKAHLVP
jgi:hypothetical protein